ncbi:PREDICTED: uncharacterized protein LOC106310937 isoform X3 [Brassica oleracea var. oleracea]|uniref:uncharacterized protein LOC106310937 isoform X3 n=1 Tax=Brassica oleracea var. oleracea TaxID=109376 RepID=UPI0006A70383|nr:PREDICTED: uncharacterized protein LOC106310937 isoform X3 [Brassica oleracea var. oleracea]
MNRVDGEREEWRREVNGLFWIERLFLFLVFVFPTYVCGLIVPLILSTTLLALPFFLFFNPNLSSVGPSGIGGFWLFLLDRTTFYLGLEYSKLLVGGFELTFLWRLTLSLSLVIHSIYIADYFLRSHQAVLPPPQSRNVETPIFTDEGDVHKEVEKVKAQESYLAMQETYKEAKTTGDKAQESYLAMQETYKEAQTTADKAQETYLAIQETYKEAKTTADKALETYLIFQEGQNKRRMIRGEDVEGFVELREQVRRISVEAENAAEEQSRATGELVDARIQQWEEDNADYLASLPLLYCNQHN